MALDDGWCKMIEWNEQRLEEFACNIFEWYYITSCDYDLMPKQLRDDLTEFYKWIVNQHKNGADSEMARELLRIFGLKHDA